jgi:hypothetical protein
MLYSKHTHTHTNTLHVTTACFPLVIRPTYLEVIVSNSSCKETVFTEIFQNFTQFCLIYRFNTSVISHSVLVRNLLPTHCRCTGFLLHVILLSDTHILDMGALDNGSARRWDLYLITHNTHNRQTSMPLAGYEPTIPSIEWPQSHSLYRAASGTGLMFLLYCVCSVFSLITRCYLTFKNRASYI